MRSEGLTVGDGDTCLWKFVVLGGKLYIRKVNRLTFILKVKDVSEPRGSHCTWIGLWMLYFLSI